MTPEDIPGIKDKKKFRQERKTFKDLNCHFLKKVFVSKIQTNLLKKFPGVGVAIWWPPILIIAKIYSGLYYKRITIVIDAANVVSK